MDSPGAVVCHCRSLPERLGAHQNHPGATRRQEIQADCFQFSGAPWQMRLFHLLYWKEWGAIRRTWCINQVAWTLNQLESFSHNLHQDLLHWFQSVKRLSTIMDVSRSFVMIKNINEIWPSRTGRGTRSLLKFIFIMSDWTIQSRTIDISNSEQTPVMEMSREE